MEPQERSAAARLALGARLRALREGAGLTLAQVALTSGLSIGYLSDVERGRRLPSLDKLVGLAAALDALVVEVLADVHPFGAVEPGPALGPPPDGRSTRRR